MEARNVKATIYVNGKNITDDITNYVKSVTYSDALSDEADTAEIELHDVNHIWREEWFPQRGDTASIELVRVDWNGDEEETLPLGSFEIDEIQNSYSYGSGNTAKVKLNSIPNSSGLSPHPSAFDVYGIHQCRRRGGRGGGQGVRRARLEPYLRRGLGYRQRLPCVQLRRRRRELPH